MGGRSEGLATFWTISSLSFAWGYRTSNRAAGSFRRPRGSGFSRRSTTRGRGNTQAYVSVSVAPVTSKGNSRDYYLRDTVVPCPVPVVGCFCLIPQCIVGHHSGCFFPRVLLIFQHIFSWGFSASRRCTLKNLGTYFISGWDRNSYFLICNR